MKKPALILVLLTITALQGAYAQFADRLVPHVGYIYSFVNMEGLDEVENGSASYAFNTIGIGSYIVLKHHNDFLSVGLDPSVQVGLNFSNQGRLNWFGQMPVFLMGRIGAASTKYNTQKIGLGAGIGAIGSYMNYVEVPDLLETKEFFVNPAAVVEGTIHMRGSTLTGRVLFSLAPSKQVGDLFTPNGSFLPNREANFGTLGVGLIYGF